MVAIFGSGDLYKSLSQEKKSKRADFLLLIFAYFLVSWMYTIIVFYRFKELTPEQEEKVRAEWEQLKKGFEKFGVRLVSNNAHAFGTDWNGFVIFEADDFEKYVKFWKWFKDRVRWYIIKTMTVIGVKKP